LPQNLPCAGSLGSCNRSSRGVMTAALHVVCYDTASDKRRRQIVQLLSRRGRRVQYSVFELLLTPVALRRLVLSLEDLMRLEDSLLIYSATGTRICLGTVITALDEELQTQVI
jgi:CRISPR-associated endonuclease Cas2